MQNVDIDALLDRHRERFRKLVETILREESGEDPFRYPLDRFRALSDDEKAELVRLADVIARDRVERELEARGARWLVLVGDEVVLASPDVSAIPPPEEVLRLGESRGLVAFLFETALIEELPSPTSAWAALDGHDKYPTIGLALHLDAEAPVMIVADLDTGSHGTLIDAELCQASGQTWFAGRHLGRSFYWSPARVDVEICVGAGRPIRKPVAIRRVRAWSTSPFVRVNPNRRALVGRDLLRAFSLSVVLRTREAETEIVGGD